MNSIWNKNFSAFKTRFPSLVELFGNPPTGETNLVLEWNISTAKNGQPTVTQNNIRLHSAYNPQREAEGAVSVPEFAQKSTTVFYGFGLGYHLVEWAKKYSDKKLVVIEPDINRFYSAMMMIDWEVVFQVPQLVLAVGCPAESVLPLLENKQSVNLGDSGVSDAYYFDLPAFTSHNPHYFDTVKTIIKRNQRKNEINAATLKKFGKLWCRNSLRNLSQMENHGFISQLKDKSDENLPFLILGAGPSLETVLPHLAELKKRCVLVCVETSLKALLRFGVEPDFIVLTDPQYWAYRHIAGLTSKSSYLITEISTYPPVFRFPCKEILLCSSQFPVGQYLENQLKICPGDLGTGGSVASTAWNFALYCGAKQIYTAGLDFAFPGKQTHIKGSSAEQTYHTISNRISQSDKFTCGSLYSANAVLSKDYKGNPVLTDSRMKMFSWWFESRLAGFPDVQTFTLGPQGLATPGIKEANLEQVMILKEAGELKEAFLKNIDDKKSSTPKMAEQILKIKDNFPSSDFLEKYPYLAPYIQY